MALSIRDPEIEPLAAEVARLTGETETEAIRAALAERAATLRRMRTRAVRGERVHEVLRRFRQEFPLGDFGRRPSKADVEAMLGFGPNGF